MYVRNYFLFKYIYLELFILCKEVTCMITKNCNLQFYFCFSYVIYIIVSHNYLYFFLLFIHFRNNNHAQLQQKKQFVKNYHNAQVVTVELNIKIQFSTVKTISDSSMICQHFPSYE